MSCPPPPPPPPPHKSVVCVCVGVVVMVCGDVGTGKSTLCRFLVNYMLNRFAILSVLIQSCMHLLLHYALNPPEHASIAHCLYGTLCPHICTGMQRLRFLNVMWDRQSSQCPVWSPSTPSPPLSSDPPTPTNSSQRSEEKLTTYCHLLSINSRVHLSVH